MALCKCVRFWYFKPLSAVPLIYIRHTFPNSLNVNFPFGWHPQQWPPIPHQSLNVIAPETADRISEHLWTADSSLSAGNSSPVQRVCDSAGLASLTHLIISVSSETDISENGPHERMETRCCCHLCYVAHNRQDVALEIHTQVYFQVYSIFSKAHICITWFTFTFSHLAEAFIQSDVQGREQSSYGQ